MPQQDEYTEEDEHKGFILVELAKKHLKDPTRPRQDPNSGKIFWEWDMKHPGEEILVVNGRVVKAWPTPKVLQAIADGLLVQSRKSETPRPADVSEAMDQRAAAEAINAAARAAALAAQNAPTADPPAPVAKKAATAKTPADQPADE